MKRTFAGLDLLRFALAVYLMVFHTVDLYPESRQLPFGELLKLGGFATSTFFLLSGFILSHVYFGPSSTALRGGARSFLVKRLTNLYPIHLISLALFLLTTVAGVNPINRFATMAMDGAHNHAVYLSALQTAFNLGLTLLMLHVWNPLYIAINPPSWSLAVLLFFYLTFPLLAPHLLSVRRKLRLLVVMWVVYLLPPLLASAMHWYGSAAVGIVENNPLLRLPEFVAGILLYGLYRERDSFWRTAPATRVAVLTGLVAPAFAMAALLTVHGPLALQYVLHNGALMPFEMALIVVCASADAGGVLAHVAARLGNAALSIFAVHLPVFLIFVKLQKLAAIGVSPWHCMAQFSACIAASKTAQLTMGSYPLYLLGTVAIALVFQEHLVVPVRDALRHRLLRRGAAGERRARMGARA